MLSIRDVPGISAGHATDASQAHDALALAISPVHTVLDGDTVFALSTCRMPAPDGLELVFELERP